MVPTDLLVQVYVQLLHEGYDRVATDARREPGRGEVSPARDDGYDPEDEMWEFLPGTVVRCEMRPLGPRAEKADTLTAVAAIDDAFEQVRRQ